MGDNQQKLNQRTTEGYVPLLLACQENQLDIAQMLLQVNDKIDKNAQDFNGRVGASASVSMI